MTYKAKNIKRLEELSALECALLLRCEHPQVIAVILSLIDSTHAAKILENFTGRLQNDIILRISTLDDIRANWIKLLDTAIGSTIKSLKKNPNVSFDSIGLARGILKEVSGETQAGIYGAVMDYDPDLNKRLGV